MRVLKYKEAVFLCIQYIENNIKEELKAESIAKQMGYSVYHFSRIFKEETGISLMEYVKDRRLLRAAEDYVTHSINVAIILAEMEADEETIIAGLLHDVIEEKTSITLKDIEESLSIKVSKIIDKVTNFNKKYSEIING